MTHPLRRPRHPMVGHGGPQKSRRHHEHQDTTTEVQYNTAQKTWRSRPRHPLRLGRPCSAARMLRYCIDGCGQSCVCVVLSSCFAQANLVRPRIYQALSGVLSLAVSRSTHESQSLSGSSLPSVPVSRLLSVPRYDLDRDRGRALSLPALRPFGWVTSTNTPSLGQASGVLGNMSYPQDNTGLVPSGDVRLSLTHNFCSYASVLRTAITMPSLWENIKCALLTPDLFVDEWHVDHARHARHA